MEIVMTKTERDSGVFEMSDVNKIIAMPLEEGKKCAIAIIESKKDSMIEANIRKAKMMVERSKNPTVLAMGMANFILAHIDPKLKVVK
jgi:hypothetical protein